MSVQLEHVFAGVGMRRRKEQREPGIDRLALPIQEAREGRARAAAGSSPTMIAAISGAFGPERRTIPMPPRPGGVAAATMVSVRVMAARAAPRQRLRALQPFFAAIAAPMRRLMFHCCAIDSSVLVTQ